ncbi:MAG: GTP-binding protein, partial [Clostridia bacterium]|nr:GTP-binding protein [Clostridia bacterium]
MQRQNIRNIAIIAHVDHGKTTMVDQLLKQNGIFRTNEVVQDRVMDSNDIERERGITILAKNTAVHYKGTKINIIDTPGHADFGGEVERILSMVDGVLLLVDAIEGCMPQTRYVLKKALGLGKKVLVVVNKVDKGEFVEEELQEQIMELFIELGATDEQFDFKTIYASAKQGWASESLSKKSTNMQPLLDAILSEIPAPVGEIDAGLQLLICNIDYDEYVGRIGIGKVNRGKLESGQQVIVCHKNNSFNTAKITRLYQFEGLKRVEVQSGEMGDIVAINGIDEMNIGETICSIDCVEPLPFVDIDEPTISMMFM